MRLPISHCLLGTESAIVPLVSCCKDINFYRNNARRYPGQALTSKSTIEAIIIRRTAMQLESVKLATYSDMPAPCATSAKKCISSKLVWMDLSPREFYSQRTIRARRRSSSNSTSGLHDSGAQTNTRMNIVGYLVCIATPATCWSRLSDITVLITATYDTRYGIDMAIRLYRPRSLRVTVTE